MEIDTRNINTNKMCIYPRLIANKRILSVPVGCGKCMECKKQKSREWSVRLQEDIKIAQTIINGIGTVGGLLQAGKLAEAMRKGKGAMEKEWGKGFKEGVETMQK